MASTSSTLTTGGMAIDHVVVAVRDLAEAAAGYAAAGLTVVPGGEHADGATHNALIAFADGAYLELIAFVEPDRPQGHRWWPLLQRGEGTVDFALRSADLAADAARLRQNGIDAADPKAGGRVRPDGQRIGWRNLELRDHAVPLPFLIEDVTPRGLRVPSGAAADHLLGVSGIAGLTILVPDLALATARYGALLGTEPTASPALIDGVVDARRFGLSGQAAQWLELAQPQVGADELRRHLAERGAGPWRIVLAGAEQAMDLSADADLRGARIELTA